MIGVALWTTVGQSVCSCQRNEVGTWTSGRFSIQSPRVIHPH